VSGASTAQGGAGGAGVNGAVGGAAKAALTLTGTQTVSGNVTAFGGAGGADNAGGTAGLGGAAQAAAIVQGVSVSATAIALGGTGGAGATTASHAAATTKATGSSGTYTASAATSLANGQLVVFASADSGGSVDGAATASSEALIGGGAFTFVTSGQSVAEASGAPNAAGTSAILKANKTIATAFGASPSFFEIGELGGAYSIRGATTQTTTSSTEVVVDLTQLTVRQDLVAGFYKGTVVGSGVTGLTFDLYADGVDVIHQAFTTATAAQTYFTNNAVDLGSLASGTLSGNTLTLKAVMSVTTTTTAGSGFYGGLIIGDPPARSAPPSPTDQFVQAMAGLSSGSAGSAFVEIQHHALSPPILSYGRSNPLA